MMPSSSLSNLANQRFSELATAQNENIKQWLDVERLKMAIALSDFIFDSVMQNSSLLPWLNQHQDSFSREANYRSDLKLIVNHIKDEKALFSALRQFRQQEMLWLAWQDFAQKISLETGLLHLSHLAEAIIMETYHWLYRQCCVEWGTPCNEHNQAQPMLILGMGKLGGGELNFSSDIDLIFTYPENGETQGARRSISNAQFFTRLGQRLIKALDQQNVDGFCYRVDMRLRPFGDSGPLVMSFAALEEYYQEQGREWERYAMIKARVMGKEQFESYQKLRQMLRPFVFRRYIDFSVIQSLRQMKSAIQSEVRRRGLKNNIKLGAGGIREIEFIAQSFQLVRGGREPLLRKRGLIETLEAISTLELLPLREVGILKDAYCFLRRLENLLQAINDKQTQTLPIDELNQARLAFAMQEQSWVDLEQKLQHHMNAVHQIFEELIGDEKEKQSVALEYQELWQAEEKSEIEKILAELSYCKASSLAIALTQFKEELARRTIGPRGREVLHQLMPIILLKVFNFSGEIALFERIFKLLNQILTRTTYLELLAENHSAIEQLIRLCAASPMVAQKLATFPMLLDELLDPNQLYNPTPLHAYQTTLFEYIARIPKEDMEQQMEQIRYFKQTQLLRIAAADIAGALPLMKVSDHLTYLAEAIVNAIVHQAWEQLAQKYGIPSHLVANPNKGYGFAVIAYGKLGGLELGYGSDLDIVFIHDCPENIQTNGENYIDGWQFYTRLAQRIMHLFSTRTSTGVLYEIDTRLRPSGASGMLVTTLKNFAEYQQNEAWVWEHQALVRARVIYGNEKLAQDFQQIRQSVLGQKRDIHSLKQEVISMRERMREHLSSKNAKGNSERFDIKQDEGGIVDIEFITQFLVLAFAHLVPRLAYWSDNVRILDEMEKAHILSIEQIKALQSAYTKLRNETHRLSLLKQSSYADIHSFDNEIKTVKSIWQQTFIADIHNSSQ